MKTKNEFKQTRRFIERDPFNPENVLECEISMDKGHRYGALIIHKINGDKLKTPQVIYGTRKLRYPFDQNGKWHFPSAIRIHSYRKYDGTNIFMYRYEYNGQQFVTYKVRLFPFLRGFILDRWKECLEKYPEIKGIFSLLPNISGFSFEMYGKNNLHLIEYEQDLDVKLLFGLKQTNQDDETELQIVPPCLFKEEINPWWTWAEDQELAAFDFNVKFPEQLGWYARDYIYNYQIEQGEHEQNLTVTEAGFKGHEGTVWYLQDKNEEWHLFKCKPESIERIHWASYPLDINIIRATAINVLEIYDTVNYENLCMLLLEEFPQQQIDMSEKRIQKVLTELNMKEQFKQRVKLAMADLEPDLDRVNILRQLSKHFAKQEMKSVYQAVIELTENN